MESFERLGKNQMIMEVPLTEKQKETLKTLETTIDFVPKVHFWAFKYYEDNGVNHIKSLVSNSIDYFYTVFSCDRRNSNQF